jgi:GNAT superfamily N-acetyltransferase
MPTESPATVTVRQAELADHERVAAFTSDTWETGDYVPHVFEEWVESDDETQRTFVAEVDGTVAGVVQATLLSDWEAWGQGIRVDPEFRGRGVADALTRACFDWARERGAVVLRVMVFSWNVMGLGQARSAGYEPVAEFRWAHPEPDPDADPTAGAAGGTASGGTTRDAGVEVVADPDAAWSLWTGSDAWRTLSGLGLDAEESWALAELTRERLAAAAADDRLFVVRTDAGTRGFTYRVRTYEREDDGVEETWAEYGLAVWRDPEAARHVLAAIARDAADLGADRTRVLVPETPAAVSDAALARVEVDGEPDFVMAADLTGTLPVDGA